MERQAEAKAEAEERAKNKPFEDRNFVVNTLHEVLADLHRQYGFTTLAGVVVAEAIRNLRNHVASIQSVEQDIAEYGEEFYWKHIDNQF